MNKKLKELINDIDKQDVNKRNKRNLDNFYSNRINELRDENIINTDQANYLRMCFLTHKAIEKSKFE